MGSEVTGMAGWLHKTNFFLWEANKNCATSSAIRQIVEIVINITSLPEKGAAFPKWTLSVNFLLTLSVEKHTESLQKRKTTMANL